MAKDHDQDDHKGGTKAKGQRKDIERNTAQKKDPKDWAELPEDEPLTKLANMAVLDRLNKLDKDNGATDIVNHWKLLKGIGKMAFALQFKVDRDASFMSVTGSKSQTNTMTNTMLQGWVTEAQVAAQEKSPMVIL